MAQHLELTFRRYRPDDLDQVLAVFHRSVHQLAANDYDAGQLAAWAPGAPDRVAWSERLSAPETWLALSDGKLAGFARIAHTGTIDLLFVDPNFSRRGIATALLAKLVEIAHARGWARLETAASITARPFFAARGFVVESAQTAIRDGVALCNYRMAMPLCCPGSLPCASEPDRGG